MKLAHYSQIELQPVKVEGAVGTQIRWLVAEKDGAPNFALRMFEVESGGHTPYHKHAWEHEVYCLEGEGTLVFEGNEYAFKANDSIYVDPDKMHQFKNTGNGKLKFLCIIPHESSYKEDIKQPEVKKAVNPFAAGKANNC
ncbi:MAG: cupin domain-containing protein [Candidatus Cloacimonetes bacterium]|nr:cupin domain-containing protein [Candidatus Cloacimonadota bacterium]